MRTVDDVMAIAARRYPDKRAVIYHHNGLFAYDGAARCYIPQVAPWTRRAVEDARIHCGIIIVRMRDDDMQLSLW